MTDISQAPIAGAKPWYASRTIWGALLAAIAPALALVFHKSIDAATLDEMAATLAALGGIVGSVIAIYGRIKAGKAIGAFGAPLILAGALALAACSSTSTPGGLAAGIEAAPGVISTATTLLSSGTPQQKFTAACDEYWAGSVQLGPMIDAVVAKQGATAAKLYQGAQVALSAACTKNPDGTYLNAASPSLATLIPQVLAAAGQLTVLFLPAS